MSCRLLFQCPVLCVLAIVPLWIAQMITGLVPCGIIVRLCYLFEDLLALLFGFLLCVLYTCLFGLHPCAFTRHAVIWEIKNPIMHSCACLPILHTNVTLAVIGRGLELFLIGLLKNLTPGDGTRQAKTRSHQNRLKFQAPFSNCSYTKWTIIIFQNFSVIFQPHSVEIYTV